MKLKFNITLSLTTLLLTFSCLTNKVSIKAKSIVIQYCKAESIGDIESARLLIDIDKVYEGKVKLKDDETYLGIWEQQISYYKKFHTLSLTDIKLKTEFDLKEYKVFSSFHNSYSAIINVEHKTKSLCKKYKVERGSNGHWKIVGIQLNTCD